MNVLNHTYIISVNIRFTQQSYKYCYSDKEGGRDNIAVKAADSRARFPRFEIYGIHQSKWC